MRDRLARLIQQHTPYVQQWPQKWHAEQIVVRQAPQARLADSATYVFAMVSILSRVDLQIQNNDPALAHDRAFF